MVKGGHPASDMRCCPRSATRPKVAQCGRLNYLPEPALHIRVCCGSEQRFNRVDVAWRYFFVKLTALRANGAKQGRVPAAQWHPPVGRSPPIPKRTAAVIEYPRWALWLGFAFSSRRDVTAPCLPKLAATISAVCPFLCKPRSDQKEKIETSELEDSKNPAAARETQKGVAFKRLYSSTWLTSAP
jgi:hypothetical protein